MTILVLDQHEDSDWNELPAWVRDAAAHLGYTKKLWDNDREPSICGKDWKKLNNLQQEAATRLGYTEELWDDSDDDSCSCSSSSCSSSSSESENGAAVLVLDKYDDSDWEELPESVRRSATELGYTELLWNNDKEPEICGIDWDKLTLSQIEAATRLGYTRTSWDDDGESDIPGDCCEDENGKHFAPYFKSIYEKWTVYCIQLYTETKDYKLQIRDGMGISMHANRHFVKNEVIVQAPVGPCNHEQLFRATPSEDNGLTPERQAFAERFLEWHATHRGKDRAGAASTWVYPTLTDFSNLPTTSSDYKILPDAVNPLYKMEIFEHEIVVVEFVPPPSNPTYKLPPDRQFEILSFDEGLIGGLGEPNYSPEKMKRRPTRCGVEHRDLEVPGHFSNHACGSFSTAYDILHPDDCEHVSRKIVPKQHLSWIEDEIRSKQAAYENGDPGDQMRTRRELLPGEEITTDYSRWHWSNGDVLVTGGSQQTPVGYFFGAELRDGNKDESASERWDWDKLPPRIQWAGRVLGYSKKLWEDAKDPPIFQKRWKHLTPLEREAVIRLTGHTNETWDTRHKSQNTFETMNEDDDASFASSSTVTSIDDLDWKELSEEQQNAATFLGYTKRTWDEDADIMDEHNSYFHGIRPEIRDAMAVLGQTEHVWEESDNYDGEYGESEPWFYCICGSPNCHSSRAKGGFRGVKYFSLEEQMQIAAVCEPWIQQNLLWKLYQLEQDQNTEAKEKKMSG